MRNPAFVTNITTPNRFSHPSVSHQLIFGLVTLDPCNTSRNRNKLSAYISSVSGHIADIRSRLLQGKKNTAWQLNISSHLNIRPSTWEGIGTGSPTLFPVRVRVSEWLAEKGHTLPGNTSISMNSGISGESLLLHA